nr:hypothetical protein GCM10020093_077420 [Planobispora longispora]
MAFAGPVAAGSLLTVLAAASPGGDISLTIAAVSAWLVSLCTWVALLASHRHRRSWWVCLLPLAGAAVFALVGSGIPLRVAFAVSEPALTEYAASLPERERWSFREERVGVFSIDRARRWQGIAQLGVGGSGGTLKPCRFAHVPGGRLHDIQESQVTHLTGDWYLTCTDFD